MDIRKLRRSIVLCAAVLLSLAQAVASDRINKLTRVDETLLYDEVCNGLDKNCRPVTIGIKLVGNDVVYTILNADFKPGHSFTIKDVQVPKYDDVTPWVAFMGGNLLYPFEYIYAVQGLLDDEDKWVVAVFDEDDGSSSNSKNMVSEDGEIYYNETSDFDKLYDYSLIWHENAWFLKKNSSASGSDPAGTIYTLRTKSALNEIPTTDRVPAKGAYTMGGIKVDKADKGLYILDGKKVIR